MKSTVLSFALLAAQCVWAAPTPTIESGNEEPARVFKRAAITDIATTGFATQNGGTKGGAGGTVTTVSTLAQFTAAVGDATARIVVVSGEIKGAQKVMVGSNKSIVGRKGAKLVGIGLSINKQKNVIIRNLITESVLAANGDAIGIQASSNVWIDHCELFSAATTNKDYYDGLVDVTHASEWVTISNSFIHDHWKASLIGHSDTNGAEDKGHLHVTQHNNYFLNIKSRAPSFRFGTGHVYNSVFKNVDSAIDSREGAVVLVESNVFQASPKPMGSFNSPNTGYIKEAGNDLGGAKNTAPAGAITVPYKYSLLGSANVAAAVVGTAGATLAL